MEKEHNMDGQRRRINSDYIKPNNKKICSIDLDGILNYYPDCWVDFINRETGLDFKDKNEAKKELSAKEYSSLKDKYRKSDFKANLKIRVEAVDILKYLKSKGYFILVVTTRPFEDYLSLAVMTKKWLDKNNVPYDTVIKKSIDSFKKYPCLDFHIEDEIEDANFISKAGYKVFLFKKSRDNEILHPNVIRIKDLKKILDYLGE